MFATRVTKVAVGSARNPAKPRRNRASRRRPKSSGNPAHLLSIGWMNPKKGASTMPKKAKRKAGSAARKNTRKNGRRNTGTKIIVVGKRNGVKGHRRRGSRNPTFFGASVTPMQMGQYVLGGLVGVTVNRVAIPLMPSMVTGSNLSASLTAFAIAGIEWWVASMLDKGFGAAVGFGALMNAATYMLNAFIPSVGSSIGLQGLRRGTGDFVPGRFSVPQNPILDAGVSGNGVAARSAYPAAYALAA